MSTTGKAIACAAVVVIVLGGAWFLSGKGAQTADTGPIKIGASLPLTGDAASYGEMMKAGIELAIKEVNDAGGIKGQPVQIVYEDDACSSTGGVDAFTKLVTVDKVAAIIGPVCSPAATAGLPIAQQHSVPAIIVASAPTLTQIGEYIFRNYPSDLLQGKFAAEYAYNTLGKHKAAILYGTDEWGTGLKDTFSKRFEELGGTIVDTEGAGIASTDVRTQLTKIKTANPDLVYIPLHPAGGVAVAKQAKLLGVSALFLGGDYFDAKEFTSVKETAGMLFTIGKIDNSDDFKARVKAATGLDSGLLTPLGYDAFNIVASAIAKAGTDPKRLQSELSKTNYTKGVSFPSISFDTQGDLKEAQFEVRVVKNGQSQTYTP